MSRHGWTPRHVASPSSAGRGLVFVDAAFDLDRFKVGLWGPALGGRVFRCGQEVLTQQEAELDSLVRGLSFIINVGWPVFRLVGDNASSIGQIAGMRARSGLKRHNRNLRRAFYLLQRCDVRCAYRPSPPSLALCGLRICPRGALLWTANLQIVLWVLSLSVGGTLRRAGCWGPLATFRRVPGVLLPVEALLSLRDLTRHGCISLPVPIF